MNLVFVIKEIGGRFCVKDQMPMMCKADIRLYITWRCGSPAGMTRMNVDVDLIRRLHLFLEHGKNAIWFFCADEKHPGL